MKTNPCLSCVFCLCLIVVPPAAGETRTWTDASTKRTLEGEYLKTSGAVVVIKLASGKTVNVAIERLSEADRAFITQQSAGNRGVSPGDRGAGQAAGEANRPAGLASYSPLTSKQKQRKDASGGHWTVRFDEACHLGFVVIQKRGRGQPTQTVYWGDKPSKAHRYSFQHFAKGSDGNQLTMAPARKPGDDPSSADAGITYEFSDPEVYRRQSISVTDAPFKVAGPLRGRIQELYSLRAVANQPVFILRVVFATDPAAAEKELDEMFTREFKRR